MYTEIYYQMRQKEQSENYLSNLKYKINRKKHSMIDGPEITKEFCFPQLSENRVADSGMLQKVVQ